MRLNNVESFINFHRVDPNTFDEILQILGPGLQAMPIRKQEHITPAERLSLILRYLASGDSMKSVGYYGFRVGASTTLKIIRETTSLIRQKFQFVFPKPSTEMWEQISTNFYNCWGFSNYLGAIDGNHVVIQALPNHNSLTLNYKHTHSVVLMAAADGDYEFVLVDIGTLGHNSDGGIFRNCKFGKAILENSEDMQFSALRNLPEINTPAQFAFLALEAFPLRKNLLRPYPGRSSGYIPPNQDGEPKVRMGCGRLVPLAQIEQLMMPLQLEAFTRTISTTAYINLIFVSRFTFYFYYFIFSFSFYNKIAN